MESYSQNFSFISIPKEKFDPLEDKEVSKMLEKWGLKERISLQVLKILNELTRYKAAFALKNDGDDVL